MHRIGKNGTFEIKWPASPPTMLNEDGYYDTNDIVELRDDGNYEFLGRANEMLMIRGGSKFQAPSVEDRLMEHPHINLGFFYDNKNSTTYNASFLDYLNPPNQIDFHL